MESREFDEAGIPPRLLAAAGRILGDRIEAVEPITGGYTAQRVGRLRLAGGQTLVLKAAPPAGVDARLDWPAELEREIELYTSHPELDRWRPRPWAALSAGGWRGLLMEDLSGAHRPPPWTDAALRAVAAGLARMHAASARAGRQIGHGDVRSDNLFLAAGRGLVLCDWAEANPGSALEDAVYWAVGVEREGGGWARDAYARYAAVAGAVSDAEVQAAAARLRQRHRRGLERVDEPARVRELRQRELAILDDWISDDWISDSTG